MLAELAPHPCRAHRRARGARRLPLLHHERRLARLQRRQAPPPAAGGRRRGLPPREAQGRRRPRGRHPAPPHRTRGDRLGCQPHDRRQPGVGRAGGDRVDERISPSSSRCGSRSRPAPTTSSATPRSGGRWRPIGVATGEHGMNRVLFKQLFQAEAIDFCQLDSARLASVNEILAVYLLAKKFGVPVCPHAGGVGLCELVQHLSIFDYVVRLGHARGPGHRVRRPPARALRRPVHRRERRVRAAERGRATARRCTRPPSPSTRSPTAPTGLRADRLGVLVGVRGAELLDAEQVHRHPDARPLGIAARRARRGSRDARPASRAPSLDARSPATAGRGRCGRRGCR